MVKETLFCTEPWRFLYLAQSGEPRGEDLIACSLIKARAICAQEAGLVNNFDTAFRSSNQKGKKRSLAGESSWRPGLQKVPTQEDLEIPLTEAVRRNNVASEKIQ